MAQPFDSGNRLHTVRNGALIALLTIQSISLAQTGASPDASSALDNIDLPQMALPADLQPRPAAHIAVGAVEDLAKDVDPPSVPPNPDLVARFETRFSPPSKEEPAPTPATRAQLTQQGIPVYPNLALDAHWSGEVNIRVFIDAQGVPYKTGIVSRKPYHLRIFDDAARLAAMQSRFEPAQDVQGQAVEDAHIMPFHFSAAEHTTPASCELKEGASAEYPQAAREQGIETTMVLAVPVDYGGQVDARGIVILSRGGQSTTLFDDSARQAAAQAFCTPSQREGTTTNGWGIVQVPYTLSTLSHPSPDAYPFTKLDGAWNAKQLPIYPVHAQRAGIEGKILLQVDIDITNGRTVATRVVERDPYYASLLDESARKWAMGAHYKATAEELAIATARKDSPFLTTFSIPLHYKFENEFKRWRPANCKLMGKPIYPESVRALGREANILVALITDDRGKPIRRFSKVVSRLPADAASFDENAMVAAMQARCTPQLIDGRQYGGLALLDIPFMLEPSHTIPTQ